MFDCLMDTRYKIYSTILHMRLEVEIELLQDKEYCVYIKLYSTKKVDSRRKKVVHLVRGHKSYVGYRELMKEKMTGNRREVDDGF